MSKPKKEVGHDRYYKETHFLYEIFSLLKDVEEQKKFLKDILTTSELRMLKRRWYVANLIADGYDLRTVANLSETSTQTVSKIKTIMEEGKGGLLLAIKYAREKQIKDRKDFLRRKSKGSSKFVKSWFS